MNQKSLAEIFLPKPLADMLGKSETCPTCGKQMTDKLDMETMDECGECLSCVEFRGECLVGIQ